MSKQYRSLWLAFGALCLSPAGSRSQMSELAVPLPGGVPLEMVWIPAGSFRMGTTEAQRDTMERYKPRVGEAAHWPTYQPEEFPAHQVTVSEGFYLGKFEVTQAQWQAVTGSLPELIPARTGPDFPIAGVSWREVQAFIGALNAAAGDTLYRLPSEAEWEYACRAGTETLWFFGDRQEPIWDYAVSASLARVGTLRPNPWGLHDVMGNVGELVRDGRRPYGEAAQADPLGALPQAGSPRVVVRGASNADPGGFIHVWWWNRCGYRGTTAATDNPRNWIGFRLLRRAAPATAVARAGWGQVKREIKSLSAGASAR